MFGLVDEEGGRREGGGTNCRLAWGGSDGMGDVSNAPIANFCGFILLLPGIAWGCKISLSYAVFRVLCFHVSVYYFSMCTCPIFLYTVYI